MYTQVLSIPVLLLLQSTDRTEHTKCVSLHHAFGFRCMTVMRPYAGRELCLPDCNNYIMYNQKQNSMFNQENIIHGQRTVAQQSCTGDRTHKLSRGRTRHRLPRSAFCATVHATECACVRMRMRCTVGYHLLTRGRCTVKQPRRTKLPNPTL